MMDISERTQRMLNVDTYFAAIRPDPPIYYKEFHYMNPRWDELCQDYNDRLDEWKKDRNRAMNKEFYS